MNQNLGLKYNKLFINGLAVVTIVSLLVSLFSTLSSVRGNTNIFLCSDTLYLPSIYKDLFIDKNDLAGWHLNPAPNFFPDMVFYFLLMFISGDFIVSSFIFSIVQYLVIALLFIKVFRTIFPAASIYYNLIMCTMLSVFLLEPFFFSKDFLYVFYIISNAYHTGAFVMTLFCLLLVLKYILRPKWTWLVLLFFAGFLSVLSDRLFIVLFAAPAVITCIVLFKRIRVKAAIFIIGTIVLFVVSGLIVFKQIDTNIYFRPVTNPFDFNVIIGQFEMFFKQMVEYMTGFSFKALTLYAFVISFVLMVYFFFYTLKREGGPLPVFYLLFGSVFSVCTMCAPMLTQRYLDYSCFRYNIYPLYLSCLHITVFIALRQKEGRSLKTTGLALLAVNGVLLIIAITQFSRSGLKDYLNYYPEIVKEVDAIAEKEKLVYGVANYWEAKKITMFSKKGVKVYSVFDDIAIHNHVANDKWFFNNTFNFVILSGFSDTSIYKEKLKDIRIVSNTENLKLVKTHPFWYYEPGGYRAYNVE